MMSKTFFGFIQTRSSGLVCVSLAFIKTVVWGLKSSVGFWLLFMLQGAGFTCCVTTPTAGNSNSHLMPFLVGSVPDVLGLVPLWCYYFHRQ